jgi:hypothetical protein
MQLSLDLDDREAEQLRRLLGDGEPAARIVAEALTLYLVQLEQAEHRRAVMRAILTGEPIPEG